MKQILFCSIIIVFALCVNHVNCQIFQQLGLEFQNFGSFLNKWFGFGQKTAQNTDIQIGTYSQPNIQLPDPTYVQQYQAQPPYPYPYSSSFEQSQILTQNLANPNLRFDPNFVKIEPNVNPFPNFGNFKSQRSIRFDGSQNPNGIYSGRKEDQVKAPAASTEASATEASTEKMFKIEEDFPCPKMGSWRWDGEYCIAVGVWPTWGCKPLDLIMTGRMGVCRNKFKMNLIHMNKPKEENSTKTAA